jgi:hypothetical protein
MNIILEPEEQKLKDDVLFLAGGDHDLALDLLVRCHAVSCDRISSGFVRARPVARSGLSPKAQVEAIDIPNPESPQAASPSA